MEIEEVYPDGNRDVDMAEALSVEDQLVLERAVTKLALFGKKVGVSPDRMIELLDSGLSVAELLAYLAARDTQST